MEEKRQPSDNSSQDRKVLSFRAPKIVQKQLAALVERWGENTTHAIHRAIAVAYEREFGKRRS